MNVSQENKRKEAVERMRLLGIFNQTIEQFEREGLVSISEPPVGVFFWAEDEDLDRIHEFEQMHNAVVYMVIRSHTTIGKMDSYLFVGDYPDEWNEDRESLTKPENGVFAYVYNHDAPDCSEFGNIGAQRTFAAGLIRIW